jgi:hypothetical protein
MSTGWPNRAVFGRHFSAAGRKGARGSFAMDAQPPLAAIDDVHLELGDVVRDFIDGTQADLGCANAERLFEGLARMVGDDLPVSQGVIHRALHRSEVAPAFG